MGDGPLDIEQIPGFEDLWNRAIEEIYAKLNADDDGRHKIAITVQIEKKGTTLKGREVIAAMAAVQVKGPTPSKIQTGLVELVRENGTLIAVPPKQADLGLQA